jgi:hypothetical protein
LEQWMTREGAGGEAGRPPASGETPAAPA